jgi:hypothetical protein
MKPMKSSMMKLTSASVVLSLAAATAACGGGLAEGKVATTSSTPGSTSVAVQIDLPKVGDPKYDKFFNDVVELAQIVADARAALEAAPATLNTAMNVTEATDFDTAIKNTSGKLKGKVIVTINASPTGADVSVVAAPGVTLSAEDRAIVDAYTKVLTEVAAVPVKLAQAVPKSIDIAKQGVVLALNAKSDFTGIKLVTTLPSVIKGIGKAKSAMDGIQNDVPVVIEKSKAMTVAIQGAV